MQGIALENTMFVWASVLHDPKRLADEPPTMPEMSELDEDLQVSVRDSLNRRARNFDYYQDLWHISVLKGSQFAHYVAGMESDGRSEHVVNNLNPAYSSALLPLRGEVELLQSFWQAADRRNGTELLAGWGLDMELLPMLVHKALGYNIEVPEQFKTDPMKRFATVDSVLRVDAIYTQGSRSTRRPLPSLPDVLDRWCIPYTKTAEYPTPAGLRKLDKAGWHAGGCIAVEKYLYGMQTLVSRYYGYTL